MRRDGNDVAAGLPPGHIIRMSIQINNTEVTIGLGMLSWRAPETVNHSLASYAEGDILSCFDHCRIFFQEITDADRAVAARYGFDVAGNSLNQGIYGGVKALLECMSDEYVLFVENDCVLIESKAAVETQLPAAVKDMEAGRADVFRLRHLRKPGEDFPAVEKYLRYHPASARSWIMDERRPAMAALRRLLRPGKAKRLKGIAAYVEPEPERSFPDVFCRTPENNLIVSSRHINWTNQAVLFKRRWMLDDILPWVAAHPSSRTVNGFPDIEKELNSRWWRRQNFHIGLAPGLFTHQRLDR